MPRKYTFNVYPKGAGRTIYRVIEFPGNVSLDKLCEAILNAFDFIHEHMYLGRCFQILVDLKKAIIYNG